ncbi:putative reverse transcriptase domain-containing protein [Tanacetum coccineum]
MLPEESDKIEKYVGGLPDMIHGGVVASKPKTMQEAIEIASKPKTMQEAIESTENANWRWQCSSQGVCGRACRDKPRLQRRDGSQIDITPTTLDHYYDVKLADERIIRLNTILRGCTLNILNHPFNINLMPVELGSFDAIIGMDWLVKYQAIIVCAEKIVRIPWGNETLIVHGDGSNRGHEARLHIISYSKTQEYMLKGCPAFLAHVTTKEVEDKSEKKRLEDVPIVRDFPKVFCKT